MSLLAQLYASRWLVLTALLAFYVAAKYRRYDRLRHFHGPSGTGWSEFWHSRVILSLQSHLKYKEVNDKYGEWTNKRGGCTGNVACSCLHRPYCSSWTQ